MTTNHSEKTSYISPSFQVASSELEKAGIRCSGGGIGVTCVSSAFGISCDSAETGVLCMGDSTVGIACRSPETGVACQEGRTSVSCLNGSVGIRKPSSKQSVSNAENETGDPHEVSNP